MRVKYSFGRLKGWGVWLAAAPPRQRDCQSGWQGLHLDMRSPPQIPAGPAAVPRWGRGPAGSSCQPPAGQAAPAGGKKRGRDGLGNFAKPSCMAGLLGRGRSCGSNSGSSGGVCGSDSGGQSACHRHSTTSTHHQGLVVRGDALLNLDAGGQVGHGNVCGRAGRQAGWAASESMGVAG